MREKIRVSTLSRRAAMRAKKNANAAGLATTARPRTRRLEPSDPLNKHAWLFRDGWVEESADEIEDIEKSISTSVRIASKSGGSRHCAKSRERCGLAGILEISERGRRHGPDRVARGHHRTFRSKKCRNCCGSPSCRSLRARKRFTSYKNLIAGAVRSLANDDKARAVLKGVAADLSEEDMCGCLCSRHSARALEASRCPR